MTETIHEISLTGCMPEPLMSYLKALGILRLVSEQKDAGARGWWRNDVFWLRSSLDHNALVGFFMEDYEPTPIVVPWSGNDFFVVDWNIRNAVFAETPTAGQAINAIIATETRRLERYRRTLQACKRALDKCGIDTKLKMEKQKWAFMQELRSNCDESRAIEWMDAAAVGTVEKFAALLGSGGGSDGNTHFSDNFMQNLWDVLPDFDNQRQAGRGRPNLATMAISRELLRDALFKAGTNHLTVKRTSSLYDSGAVGGPNATQGMERKSLSNPWNVILALEGTISFAGAVTKRLAANAVIDGAFPFHVSTSVTIQDGLADKERTGMEIWLPLWTRRAQSIEVLTLLSEGRAQCGPRPARTGVDMARAVASLGVDRGIEAFGRYAVLKGRVGGENYNTAISLGRFHVLERQSVDLLRQIDPWLDQFRKAVETSGKTSDKIPPRFASALRNIDSAIFDFCRYGGKPLFQRILIALGRAERELALTEGKVGNSKTKPKPLVGLSKDWIDAADDNSREFEIALAMAGIYDTNGKIGPLRANLEPVAIGRSRTGDLYSNWAEKDRSVVWNAADLAANLANVLQRRVMDVQRQGCENLPLASQFGASIHSVASFIEADLDDRRIEELIWGLMLIDDLGASPPRQSPRKAGNTPLPREYALLKLVFLPRPLAPDPRGDKIVWRLAREGESGLTIRPEPRILPLLRAGRVGEACRIAAQRLRVSGLQPMPGSLPDGRIRDADWAEPSHDPSRTRRLAAALLVPIGSEAIDHLVQLVCRNQSAAAEAMATLSKGESQ